MTLPARNFLAITGRGAAYRRSRSAGYTLLEVCAVIAMMVLLAALAVPSIVNRLGESEFDASIDIVRARLADARSMAIQLGKPVRFAFTPGTGRYQIAADDDDVWDSSTSGPVTSDSLIRGELRKGVIFGSDAATITNGDASSQGGGSWQTAGVFLPEGGCRGPVNSDGTSNDDARFYFGKAGVSPLAVELRGITGTSRIFDPADEGQ